MPTAPHKPLPLVAVDSSTARPSLPIVRFGRDASPIEVFFSVMDATASARAFPGDEYYDVRGFRLTRVEGAGALSLEARGKADPVVLQRRLVVETRRAAQAAQGGVTSEVDAVLRWLAAAPSPEYMVHGLACAPLNYDDVKGRNCVPRCSRWQRIFRRDCCPR